MKPSEFHIRVWSESACGNGDCKCNGFTYGKQALATLQTIDNDNAEIELWSGYIDQNGKHAYANDILLVKEKDEEYLGIIRYENNTWGFDFGNYTDELGFVVHFCGEHFEVIGNIHENPELLESIREAGVANEKRL